jgi:site-specific DNA-methyltransferase (adenine-specific)/modification methylase
LNTTGGAGAELHLGDCLEVLEELELDRIDAVVTDPPYGMSLRPDYASRGCGISCPATDYTPIAGDDRPFDPSPWIGFPRVVLFGAQYFADRLPASGHWLIWDKRCGIAATYTTAEAELAWVIGSTRTAPRIFRHVWHGMIKDSEREDRRLHPTQKPVALMKWVLDQAGIPAGATVLDPFMGSGSTGVACIETGRRFVGVELEPAYFEIATDRIDRARQQLNLFTETPTRLELHRGLPGQ